MEFVQIIRIFALQFNTAGCQPLVERLSNGFILLLNLFFFRKNGSIPVFKLKNGGLSK